VLATPEPSSQAGTPSALALPSAPAEARAAPQPSASEPSVTAASVPPAQARHASKKKPRPPASAICLPPCVLIL
jgi:hypothetical protein